MNGRADRWNRVRHVNVPARMVVAVLAAVMVVSVPALPLPFLVPTLSRTLLVPLAGASAKPSFPKTLMPGNVVRTLGIPPTPTLAMVAVAVGGTTATVPVTTALRAHHGRMTPGLGTARSLVTEISLAGPLMNNGKVRKSLCPSTSKRFSLDSHGLREMMARRARLRRSWRMIALVADGAQ